MKSVELLTIPLLLYALPRKSQALRGKFTERTGLPVAFAHGQARLCPTSQALRASSPCRGASGEEVGLSGMPRPLLQGEVALRSNDGEVVRRTA